MPPSDRSHHGHIDSPGDPQRRPLTPRTASTPAGSNADAEESAAHIAEMVRRTAARLAAPSPSAVVRPDVAAAVRPPIPAVSAAQPIAHPVAQPAAMPVRPTKRQPTLRTLVAAGTVAAVLIGGVVAMSRPGSTEGVPTSPNGNSASSVPAGYAVKVTDVITDCASHARGQARLSFENQNCVKATRSLATGQVSGRPALFVTSRVEMASAEAAASIKQVLDGNGTGNLSDLLREGRTFPGAPERMPASGYVSVQTAKVVAVAEAGFADGGRSSNTDAALRVAAAQVAAIVGAQN